MAAISKRLCTLAAILLTVAGRIANSAEPPPPVPPPPQSPVVEKVFAAWERRAAALRTGRFEYLETKFEEHQFGLHATTGDSGAVPNKPTSIVKTNVKNRRTFVFGPGKFKNGYDGFLPSSAESRMVPRQSTTSFDGQVLRYYRHPQAGGEPGGAEITRATGYPNLFMQFAIKPPILVFRPFDPGLLAIDRTKYTAKERAAVKRGQVYTVLTGPKDVDGFWNEFWVDPARDYLPVRYRFHGNGGFEADLWIEYRREPGFGWFPHRWIHEKKKDDGTFYFSSVCELVKAEFNPTLKPDEFEIAVSPRSLVIDHLTGNHFAILPDGTRMDVKEKDWEKIQKLLTAPALQKK